MLQCLPGYLQHHPLLRVHGFGLTRGNPEEISIKARHIGQETTPLRRHPAGREGVRIIELVGIPAIRRDFADLIHTVSQERPISFRTHPTTRETAADSDHRHRLRGRDTGGLVEMLGQRALLVGGHGRNSAEDCSHQNTLSPPAEADSTLSNNSSSTLLEESSVRSAPSSSRSSGGTCCAASISAK